jgi:glycine oxidase
VSLSNHAGEHVVIGAGVIGCAVADELARRGASVLLVDARGVGQGATQASAGVLAPYIKGIRPGPLQALAARSLADYDRFIDRVADSSGATIHYVRPGSITVATAEESADDLRDWAGALATAGVRCSLLDGPAACAAEPRLAPDVTAGLLVPDHGIVAAGELTRALSGAAAMRGVQVRTPARVRRIAWRRSAIDVDIDGDHLAARAVVLAAGSWSGEIEIEGVPPLPVRPVRGQLMQLAWSGPPLARSTWGSRCYLVPERTGTLLVGATTEDAGFDERATVAGVRDLLDAACDLVPHAWQAGFVAARVGLRPGTPDHLPIIGPSGRMPGLVYATGHFRNGVLLAPVTAEIVADIVLEGRSDPMIERLGPQRFGDC